MATNMSSLLAKRTSQRDLAYSLQCSLLAQLESGTHVAVVTLLGSLCPVTLGHVQSFEEARQLLLGTSRVRRPAQLETFGEVLGFVSLNPDRHVSAKLREKGEPSLSCAERRQLVQLAVQDLPWMNVETYEGATLADLERDFPHLRFTHFCMNGADDVLKYRKYTWSGANNRFITMGRPGFTEELVKCMTRSRVDPEAGHFILGPELPEISSTDARKALALGDRESLNHLLDPRVTEWCLQHGPYRVSSKAGHKDLRPVSGVVNPSGHECAPRTEAEEAKQLAAAIAASREEHLASAELQAKARNDKEEEEEEKKSDKPIRIPQCRVNM